MKEKTLRPYQKELIQEIRTGLAKHKRVIMQLGTGGGKCYGAGTQILMFNGSIKNVEDIVIGDILMGDDSTPRIVKSTCVGQEKMYEVIPIKGDRWICNESHILALRYSDKRHNLAKINITVKDYLKKNNHEKHLLKLYRTGVEFEEKPTGIDPYLLGLWIADGNKTKGAASLNVNADDTEILEYLRGLGARFVKEKSNCYSVYITKNFNDDSGLRKNANCYSYEFRKCMTNLDHKHIFIPDEYKINSRENRLQLLAGLIDGDGHLHNNGFEIITKYEKLSEDILFLARSLGLAAYKTIKTVDLSKIKKCVSTECKDYFRISISGDTNMIPNKLKRKKAGVRGQIKDVLNTGFTLEDKGEGTYYGFELEGNNRLFLLGDFTVSHNTVIFSYIAKQSQAKNSKILILSSRTRMLFQNGGTLESVGLKISYVNPKYSHIPKCNVVAGMAQTIKNRVKKEEWREFIKTINILIIDECHETVADYIFDYITPECFVIGCTATPHRYSKQKQLGHLYNAIVSGIDIEELISLHYLTKARHFSLPAPKLDTVSIDKYSGDYNQRSLARVFESKQVYTGVVSEYKRITPDKKAICFCVSSVQAIAITQEFNEQGVSAKYVLSGSFDSDKTYSDEQSVVFEEFANNKFKVLVNVGMAVSSFDCPDIEVCILNFSTISITKYLQAIGRGARIFPGKEEFYILDFGNNIERHGLYQQAREWNLWHDEGSVGGLQQSKLCDPDRKDINGLEGCGRLVPISCKVCPACGRVFITEKHEYQLYLEEVGKITDTIPEHELSIGQWAIRKKISGWKTNRILIQVCLKNVPYEKKAFKEAAEALKIKPSYWYFFNENIWSKIKNKRK